MSERGASESHECGAHLRIFCTASGGVSIVNDGLKPAWDRWKVVGAGIEARGVTGTHGQGSQAGFSATRRRMATIPGAFEWQPTDLIVQRDRPPHSPRHSEHRNLKDQIVDGKHGEGEGSDGHSHVGC